MEKEKYIIQINEEARPFNVYMVLPLSVFKKVHRLLSEEILQGLVDSDQQNQVMLHLLVDDAKLLALRKIMRSLHMPSQVKVKKVPRYYKHLIDKRKRSDSPAQ